MKASASELCVQLACIAAGVRRLGTDGGAETTQALSDLLELIDPAAGNGFDCHPDKDDRVKRARALVRNEYPDGGRRDDVPDYRTAEQWNADKAHQGRRDVLAGR